MVVSCNELWAGSPGPAKGIVPPLCPASFRAPARTQMDLPLHVVRTVGGVSRPRERDCPASPPRVPSRSAPERNRSTPPYIPGVSCITPGTPAQRPRLDCKLFIHLDLSPQASRADPSPRPRRRARLPLYMYLDLSVPHRPAMLPRRKEPQNRVVRRRSRVGR